MYDKLLNFNPKEVLKYFYEISQIPRGSGKEKAISDYIINFAKKRNLEYYQDQYNNVLIKKLATKTMENAPVVILQGHMDMVWEKNRNTIHNFDIDPIKLKIVDDYIYATDTTLGADNGIAVAICLAILDANNITHPTLEVLLTVEEETGLTGALNFDASKLSGRLLINLDSDKDNQLLTSCAGGIKIHHKIQYNKTTPSKDIIPCKISITGLKGGHSGMDIHKGRGNANKLLGRILYSLNKEMKLWISDIWGGAKDNAIPRESEAIILFNKTKKENFDLIIKQYERYFNKEYHTSDPNIKVNIDYIDKDINETYDKNTTEKIIQCLIIIPSGIESMSMDIDDLVESSNNLGVIKQEEDKIILTSAARSSINSKKDYIVNKCNTIADAMNIECTTDSEYPGWSYDEDSKLREHMVKTYQKLFNEDPEVVAIHAGVECGLFKEKLPDLDMISIGPNMYDVHTPEEHVSISSINKVWQYLLETLATIG